MIQFRLLPILLFFSFQLTAQSLSKYELMQFKEFFKAENTEQDFVPISDLIEQAHSNNSTNPVLAGSFYRKADQLAGKLKNKNLHCRLLLDYAFQCTRQGNFKSADSIIDLVKNDKFVQQNYFARFCLMRTNALSNKVKGNLKDALAEALKAKAILTDQEGKEKDETLSAFNQLALVNIQSDIANLYNDTKQFDKSIQFHKENIVEINSWDDAFMSKVDKDIKEKELYLANTFNNLSLTLINQRDWKEISAKDTAIENFLEKIIALNKRTNNLNFLASNYYNYSVYFEGIKDNTGRKFYLEKALEINRELENENGILICSIELADVLLTEKNELPKALKLAEEAIKTVRNYPEWGSRGNIYLVYSRALSLNNRYEEATQYFDSSQVFMNMELKSTFDKQITEMQTKYETAEKEKKIIVLNADKQIQQKEILHQKSVRNTFIAGFTLMLIFASVFLVQRNRISKEKARSDELLLNILPSETAEELKATGTAKAKSYDMVTILFTDFQNFTQASERLSAENLVKEINFCYSEFDKIIGRFGIEKIKTIGDSYMCAGGLPATKKSHPIDMINAALEIRNFMIQYKSEFSEGGHNGAKAFEIRIGIHTGPVVAGIVGIKKFAYDIWGDAVNIASRMESSGEIGKVNISGTTYELVKENFNFTYRGKVQAKNKGEIDMYFVEYRT